MCKLIHKGSRTISFILVECYDPMFFYIIQNFSDPVKLRPREVHIYILFICKIIYNCSAINYEFKIIKSLTCSRNEFWLVKFDTSLSSTILVIVSKHWSYVRNINIAALRPVSNIILNIDKLPLLSILLHHEFCTKQFLIRKVL